MKDDVNLSSFIRVTKISLKYVKPRKYYNNIIKFN